MTSEVRRFLIELNIKDKEDNQIKELSKQVDLKIEWKGEIGYLNPEWHEYRTRDNKRLSQHDRWRSRGEVIRFEKDGKKYDVLVKFYVKGGLFRDKVLRNIGYDFFSPASENASFACKSDNEKEQEQMSNNIIKPVQRRWEGPILVTIIIFVIVVALIAYVWWEAKRKQKTKLK